MDTALPQKFPFILDRNLAKANCTENRVFTSCDTVVLDRRPNKNGSNTHPQCRLPSGLAVVGEKFLRLAALGGGRFVGPVVAGQRLGSGAFGILSHGAAGWKIRRKVAVKHPIYNASTESTIPLIAIPFPSFSQNMSYIHLWSSNNKN